MAKLVHLITPEGFVSYHAAWNQQREIFAALVDGSGGDTLMLLEHRPVYTLGRVTKAANVLLDEAAALAIGADIIPIDRGGDVTYHGPGQLVGYPILNLAHFKEDLGWYLRALEESIIHLLKSFNLVGFRIAGQTGVWVGSLGSERKICAIGIRCSRWCTMHGFALNVNTDLSYFKHIIPCGIADKAVTSLQNELGRSIELEEVKAQYSEAFSRVFEVELAALGHNNFRD